MFSRTISVSLGLMALFGLVAAESHQVTFTNNVRTKSSCAIFS
jgi:hypothetical protein